MVKDKIVLERQRKGISANELADLAGLTKAAISRYENSVFLIPADLLKRIADALECDFDSFVSENPKCCMLSSEISRRRLLISWQK